MITDLGLRFATAEATPSGGPPGGIGATSVALNLDASGFTERVRTFNDVGGGRRLELSFNVDTAYTCATFGATIEFRLISLPITASLLSDAGGGAKSLFRSLVATDIADASPDLADTFLIVGHGLSLGTPIFLTSLSTTTGVANSTIYYVVPTTADRFKVATSLANALAGTTIDLTGGDGTATVNFIPTVHGSSGTLPMYVTGVPGNHTPLVAGSRFSVPLRPRAHLTSDVRIPNVHSAAGPSGLRQPIGAGPKATQLATAAQRYYHLHVVPSHTITAGAITCELVVDAGNALNYMPAGQRVIG